ncbi:ABC transporter ATP-binding protein [Microlunatus capsulatus]|uniref:ABC transport system ATP-binding protein n=1 Tax=Microlunatus capsulatus TaxID=99117 RepID=A0ABS4Z8E2_9ACTN|nr:putative ABC transport system ATP-binding protein [Microlunatus capsulatus]
MRTTLEPPTGADPTPGTRPGRPAAGDAAVRAVDLVKTYGSGRTAVRALDGVSVDVTRGQLTAVMGPSGSGKSTLMHCLAGLDTVTSGQVFLGGREISGLRDRELTAVRRDQVGFVFQAFNLLPTLTAAQNITLPLELAGRRVDPGLLQATAVSLGLQDRLSHRPSELSGGQQQRVAIARALITRPDVVFADEPTGALDSRTGQQLLAQLRSASRELGQTIVMVTHDPGAAAHADRVLLLADGALVDDLDAPGPDDLLAALTRLGS